MFCSTFSRRTGAGSPDRALRWRKALSSTLFINAVVYAEISIRFSRIEELEDALPRSIIAREPIPYEAAFLAGKVFLAYRRAGGTRTAPLPDGQRHTKQWMR